MKKLLLVTMICVLALATFGCSYTQNADAPTQEKALESAERYIKTVYTVDQILLGLQGKMLEQKVAEQKSKVLFFLTTDMQDYITRNRLIENILNTSSKAQRFISIDNVDLKVSNYDEENGKIFIDYDIMFNLQDITKVKSTMVEHVGQVALVIEDGIWKINHDNKLGALTKILDTK